MCIISGAIFRFTLVSQFVFLFLLEGNRHVEEVQVKKKRTSFCGLHGDE